jgi:hypothetical protein
MRDWCSPASAVATSIGGTGNSTMTTTPRTTRAVATVSSPRHQSTAGLWSFPTSCPVPRLSAVFPALPRSRRPRRRERRSRIPSNRNTPYRAAGCAGALPRRAGRRRPLCAPVPDGRESPVLGASASGGPTPPRQRPKVSSVSAHIDVGRGSPTPPRQGPKVSSPSARVAA